MTVDWTINVGILLMIGFTLVGFAGGGFGLYFGIKGNLDRQAILLEAFGSRMISVEGEMRAMRDVLTQVAVQDERLSSMDQRLQSQTVRLDNLTERVNRRLNHADE
jgi:hypothetical protein